MDVPIEFQPRLRRQSHQTIGGSIYDIGPGTRRMEVGIIVLR